MTRAAWTLACVLSLAPLALAQEFPKPASIMQGQPRLAQAPGPINPAPVPPLVPQPEPAVRPGISTSMSELAPTPEMWFYERSREEHSDPRNAVRAHAEYRSEQRRRRLAAMQWFGYSNARPSRAVTPTTLSDSPRWGSNTQDPHIWSGTGRSTIVHLPASPVWR